MTPMVSTIPLLCPFTRWIDSWNPLTSVIPNSNSRLDLKPVGMNWFDLQDSLIGCPDCPECIAYGTMKYGVCRHKSVAESVNLAGRFWAIINATRTLYDFQAAMVTALHASW